VAAAAEKAAFGPLFRYRLRIPMISAILAYVIASLIVLRIEGYLLAATEQVPVTGWLADHVYVPLLRYLCVLVLLLVGYPAVFGLDEAPPLAEVLFAASGRVDTLINAGLMLSLLLPLVPLVNQVPGLILTAQAIFTSCLIFAWAAPGLGVAAPLFFMGWPLICGVAALNVMAYLMGRALLALYPHAQTRPASALLMDALRLLAGLPAVLLYALALGRQV
jgi:hypothetical protein